MNNSGDTFEDQWSEEGEMDQLTSDPLESLNKRDQDLFFRVLDLLPREQLEPAMDYFMDHPSKITAVVNYVKQQRDLIKNHDIAALKQLFDRERIVLEQMNTVS
jgi:hypothetical protein